MPDMFVVMGGTGHVGSATARSLLGDSESVAIVVRRTAHSKSPGIAGLSQLQADINDVSALRRALQRGHRAFLLNPPGDTTGDTEKLERETAANILAALDGSELDKVVAESTGGAQPGTMIGDLGSLWEFEEGLRKQPIPAAINRAAYYMSNWDKPFKAACESGKLTSLFPADLKMPMVGPKDLGRFAADRLRSGLDDVGVRYAAGPKNYSARDVAKVFERTIGRSIVLEIVPPERWVQTFLAQGFSGVAANSYAGMTAASINGGFAMPEDAWRGSTTLESYISELAQSHRGSG
jgi:uncharacterized protein YbjT (DUF2867 family)